MSKSKTPKPAASKSPPGSDPLVAFLKARQIPLTRENYLMWAYPEGLPDPWTAELEAELPKEIQINPS